MTDLYQPEIEAMPRSRLRELQWERLRWQLDRCYRESPFYREKWERAQVKLEQIQRPEDLRLLPVVTKDELRAEQAAHPPFGRFTVAPRADWRELHPSSGTTGNPVNTIWSERDADYLADVTARTMYSFGTRPGDIIQNAFSYGLWVAGMSCHYGARRLGCFVIPIGAQLTNRQIEYLQDPGSKVLLATPSYALHIAEKLAEAGVSPDRVPLRLGCFGGEGGTEAPATRAKLERGLGIDAFDYYGLAEIGPTFASECAEKEGLHWSEDLHYIEVIDPETMEPVPEGETGVLVLTHLVREATPMVRYWTNDYARVVNEPCRCGRTHARSPGGILGRHDDLVIYKGAKFYPVQVEKVVRAMPELGDEYKILITQGEGGVVSSCTVVAEYHHGVGLDGNAAGLEWLAEGLSRRLKEELLVTPEVRLEPFGTLERSTFKAKRLERR